MQMNADLLISYAVIVFIASFHLCAVKEKKVKGY